MYHPSRLVYVRVRCQRSTNAIGATLDGYRDAPGDSSIDDVIANQT